jgi:hypothetical protein
MKNSGKTGGVFLPQRRKERRENHFVVKNKT